MTRKKVLLKHTDIFLGGGWRTKEQVTVQDPKLGFAV